MNDLHKFSEHDDLVEIEVEPYISNTWESTDELVELEDQYGTFYANSRVST